MKKFSNTLSHYRPAEKARPVKAGSHYLPYELNLNAEKPQPSADLNPKQHAF